MRKAVYAASFDPPTKGHLWVISQGAGLFDKLYVVVAANTEKMPLFTEQERLGLLMAICEKPFPSVEVCLLGQRYVADFAKTKGAFWNLRGIRNEADLLYEMTLRDENNRLNLRFETVFIPRTPELSNLSSSFIKGLVGPKGQEFEGWEEAVKPHLTSEVYRLFVKKIKERTR